MSFDLLAGLPANVANSVAEQVVSGVVLLIQKYPEVVRSVQALFYDHAIINLHG